MSIGDELVDRVQRKMLYALWPKRRSSPARRAMLLTEEMHVALTAYREDPAERMRFGELRADLEHFVTSAQIDRKYLFHLYPMADAVWEIRSVREAPSIRVLGFIAAQDVFVAVTYALREDLGAWQSREWKTIKRRARAQWNALFQPYQPKFGTDPTQCVTGVIGGKFYKSRG